MAGTDKTFGVKVSEDIYNRAQKSIEKSGDMSKVWFEKVLAIAELNELKVGSTDFTSDLTELEVHTSRIYELVVNMVNRSTHLKESATKELIEKIDSKDATILTLQQELQKVTGDNKLLTSDYNSMVEKQEIAKNEIEQYKKNIENTQSLIQEYKDKIDTLSTLVTKYQGFEEENRVLTTENNSLIVQNRELEVFKETTLKEKSTLENELQEIKAKEEELQNANKALRDTVANLELNSTSQLNSIEELTEDMDELNRKHETVIETINENYEDKIHQLKNQKELEKERSLLELERKYQKKIEKLNEGYNERIAALYMKLDNNSESKENIIE